MSGVSLPALARALSAELARVAGLLTVALASITTTPHHLIPRLPAQELLHARRCVVSLLRQIGSSYLGQEPLWPAELTRPAFPSAPIRDGGPVHPWQAGDLIEACPEILGLVALPWSEAWARWAGEIEELLGAIVPVTEVAFRPDDGFPICAGYMIGADDGKSTRSTPRPRPLAPRTKADALDGWGSGGERP